MQSTDMAVVIILSDIIPALLTSAIQFLSSCVGLQGVWR